MLVRTQSHDSLDKINNNPPKTWHYIFAPTTPRHPQYQWLISCSPARTV